MDFSDQSAVDKAVAEQEDYFQDQEAAKAALRMRREEPQVQESTAKQPCDQALLIACETTDATGVASAIAEGASPNGVPGAPGMTPLVRAIRKGNKDIVTTLIAAGADINLVVNGHPPLVVAINEGQYAMAEYLMEQHGDKLNINITSRTNKTAAMVAAYHGNAALFKSIAARGADLKMIDDNGYSVETFANLALKAGMDGGKEILDFLNAEVLPDGGKLPSWFGKN